MRLWLYGTALVALLGALWWVRHAGYQAGEAATVARYTKQIEAANGKVREADAKYKSATADLSQQLADAIAKPAQIKIEARTLVKEVIREGPTCPDVADDFGVRWNAISAGLSPETTPSAVPAASDHRALRTSYVVQDGDL